MQKCLGLFVAISFASPVGHAQQTRPTQPTVQATPQPSPAAESKPYWERVLSPDNFPNLILCATGIAGVMVALCTLQTIARQTKATEDSVKAMQDSVNIVLSKERARIELTLKSHLWKKSSSDIWPDTRSAPAITFRVRNVGPTHAFNMRFVVGYDITSTDDPVSLNSPDEIPTTGSIFKADAKDWHPVVHLAINSSQLSGLLNGTQFMQVIAKVSYVDVFGEERETRLRMICKQINGRDQWLENGSPDENMST